MAWMVLDSVYPRVGVAGAYGQPLSWRPIEAHTREWAAAVREALQSAGVSAADVAEATVIQGIGGFSDTRSAVLFANTLRWQQPKLILYEVVLTTKPDAPLKESEIVEMGKRAEALKPTYFAEPNITKPKQ